MNRSDSKADAARKAELKAKRLAKSIRAHWAAMTPKQHAARVRKMLAGRGVTPRKPRKPTAKALKLRKSLKAHWAAMSPAQHAARVRKMLAGRGLKPKSK